MGIGSARRGCRLQGQSLVGATSSRGSTRRGHGGATHGHNACLQGRLHEDSGGRLRARATVAYVGATTRGQGQPPPAQGRSPAGKGSHRLYRGGHRWMRAERVRVSFR
ncbi:hypothetical protein B296_00058723 [Ensete ventricosum]|uniref:Uncharacterized protein n=1 Tax=Ensete ventricosum TaxID=4639 RepID=A0A426X1C6_ENSVE|nr:hypothetical protein B296_00058723 [Ensete ventricosum]